MGTNNEFSPSNGSMSSIISSGSSTFISSISYSSATVIFCSEFAFSHPCCLCIFRVLDSQKTFEHSRQVCSFCFSQWMRRNLTLLNLLRENQMAFIVLKLNKKGMNWLTFYGMYYIDPRLPSYCIRALSTQLLMRKTSSILCNRSSPQWSQNLLALLYPNLLWFHCLFDKMHRLRYSKITF